VKIKIIDDENWEPDEDFFVQLYDAETLEELSGRDTRTRITIIDDDKPGQISFVSKTAITAIARSQVATVEIKRDNGSDGVVTVDFKTEVLDNSSSTATPGVDFVEKKGTVTFKH